MYKNLIEKICGELQIQMVQEDENMVMKAIRKVGVNVDKEELIKTLNYDRNQYSKGYNDGIKDVFDNIRAELIQSIQNGTLKIESGNEELFRILDKYSAEGEVQG